MTTTKTATRATVDANEKTSGNGPETAGTATVSATGTVTHPTPDRIGGAVWSVLTDHPGATAATLAAHAGVGVAVARRALIDLEKTGFAARTPGGHVGGKRAADTWRATPADEATGAHAAATGTATPDGPPMTDEPPAVPVRDATETADEADRPTGDGGEQDVEEPETADAMDQTALTEAHEALSALTAVISAASSALEGNDRSAALEAAEAIYRDSAKARRLIKTATRPRLRSGSGKPHANPGELRAKVAAHLAAHPGLQFTPHEVGKAIGHSAGAVANALDKLTEAGQAVLTCDRPRRFTATAEATTSTASDAASHTATAPATA